MAEIFIPVANPKAQYHSHQAQIDEAIHRVLESPRYILGEEVQLFESEFAQFHQVPYCVGVGNGTDAISLALKACGVTPGDEVITVSHTAVATVAAIEQIGAVPVFCDISRSNRCMDPNLIEPLISSKTRAILPVHIYGQPAPIEEIQAIARSHGLKTIEDCAQAHGAAIHGEMVGTFGDAATFSFYPTKNLGAIGDGGAIITSSVEIANKVRLLAQYGWQTHYISTLQGVNSRLDEIQAAILRVKLLTLAKDNQRRNEIARQYIKAIAQTSITPPNIIPGYFHVFHLFVIETENRDELKKYLEEHGIGTGIHYPMAVHQQPAYLNRIRGCDSLKNTEDIYSRILSLPMYPELTDQEVNKICNTLLDWSSRK
jgi:dTDP-4-amino-4,6-dideoxygalactose transaminase